MRVAKDPAFKGFRESGNRMKEASPIASALYNQIPKEKKQHALYRTLTGEAFKMLKEGIDADTITEKLQQLYIDPVLNGADKSFPDKLSSVISSDKPFKLKGAIYLGRNKKYKKFKVWLMPGRVHGDYGE